MALRPRKNYVHLARTLAVADFKVRFNSSVLGYLWYLLKPLLMFSVLYAVFSVYMRFAGQKNYPLYLFTGLILWDFFASGSKIGIEALSQKSGLINNIYFPRAIIVVAANATAVITLVFNLLVLSLFLIYKGFWPGLHWLWLLVILVPLELILLGVSLALSALNLAYRDVLHTWEVVLQLGFWATPIIYPVQIVPAKYRAFLLINPMARIITYSRHLLLDGRPPPMVGTCVLFGASLLVFVAGYLFFRWREPHFAEEL